MPYVEKPIEKIWFTVGEVAKELEVATSCVRFWLQEFGMDEKVKRGYNHHGADRRLTRGEIDQLKEIKRLLTVELYTIAGARRQLRLQVERKLGKTEIANSLRVI